MSIDQRIQDLTTLTREQLKLIRDDFLEDPDVSRRAGELVLEIDVSRLRQSVQDFDQATRTFVDLTAKLLGVIEGASSEGRSGLNPAVREAGAILAELAGDQAGEHLAKTVADLEDAPTEIDDALGPPTGADPPLVGTVRNSRQLSMIADEYRAMFSAAAIRAERSERVGKAATRLVGFRARYDAVENQLGIPWYFVGLIHSMESSCNFGTHLHNGDRLTGRTTHVPPNRPPAEVGDPPFTWEQSAVDALRSQKLHIVSDWSLPCVLFRLEKYNGWGYRLKSQTSPYLWSFTDRYISGKYVADGRYDPNAVSEQCGAAAILKRLQERGDVVLRDT
jgi:lysozyme family protein